MIAALVVALSVNPAFSGSWYAPERSGEGFTLQVLDNGSALALWFTYPPAGSAAQQAWIYAQDGSIEGDRIRFSSAITTRGPRFGAEYDPAQVRHLPWGTLEFRFTGCNSGEVSYAGPAGWGSGRYNVTRLSAIADLECTGKRRLGANGARTLDGLRQRSGSWFDPARNGSGWTVEELPDGRALVYWFTYDESGEQAWTVGTSPSTGSRLDVADNLRPVGANFGAAFDPARVQRTPWGRLELDFDDCARGTARYASTLAGYGAGTLRPVRLTRLAGSACIDGTPAAPTSGTWGTAASMPRPTSEMATASLGGMSYVVAGYGDSRGFKRFDPAADTWTSLAPLPGSRDHGLAAAIGGSVYFVGGYHNNESSSHSSAPGWRYDIASGQWTEMAQLPNVVASGAAALDGLAYFGDISGDLHIFDPRIGTSRVIRGDNRAVRDHSNVVAFQGEIWMIGGRDLGSGETGAVSIFDPASETWRRGPALNIARAGFAAAASPTHIIVAGGELVVAARRALSSVEAIAAGQDAWANLPARPSPIHGVGGASHGNAVYTLGGSTIAAVAANSAVVRAYRWSP